MSTRLEGTARAEAERLGGWDLNGLGCRAGIETWVGLENMGGAWRRGWVLNGLGCRAGMETWVGFGWTWVYGCDRDVGGAWRHGWGLDGLGCRVGMVSWVGLD